MEDCQRVRTPQRLTSCQGKVIQKSSPISLENKLWMKVRKYLNHQLGKPLRDKTEEQTRMLFKNNDTKLTKIGFFMSINLKNMNLMKRCFCPVVEIYTTKQVIH